MPLPDDYKPAVGDVVSIHLMLVRTEPPAMVVMLPPGGAMILRLEQVGDVQRVTVSCNLEQLIEMAWRTEHG